jgi:hypothetical protein
MKRTVIIFIVVFIFLVPVAGIIGYQVWWHANFYVKEHTDYGKSQQHDGLTLVDDRLEEKNPQFDPELFDSRPLGDWRVNKNEVVIKLDCPDIKPRRHNDPR